MSDQRIIVEEAQNRAIADNQKLKAELKTARAQVSALQQWQPIATAPKDAVVDVWLSDDTRIANASYRQLPEDEHPSWCIWSESDDEIRWFTSVRMLMAPPTHWMPLPAPPTTEEPQP